MTGDAERILGVEGGGTKTAWVLVEREGEDLRIVEQGKLPPSNLRLTTQERLRAILNELPRQIARVGIFLAGCVTAEDRQSLTQLASEVWAGAKILAGSDRDSGMAAALGKGDGIVVNAGTGSSVTGRRGDKIEKAGGWGHILGDAGGGYFLSIQALRVVLREYDLRRGEMDFAAEILRALSLNNLDELVRWAQNADKMQVAMLTPVVFAAAHKSDAHVTELLEEGARVLAEYTEAVATRLHLLAPKVVLIGGLFEHDQIYAAAFRRRLKKNLPDARVSLTERAPEFGAAWLAAEMEKLPHFHSRVASDEIESLGAALTEQRNPRSENLDKLSARKLVELFVEEEKVVADALRARIVELTSALELVSAALRNGGRLFYVGAGTSGRLGVLDASEIPPTFGAPPDLVQGIMAGGLSALYRSAEGAEDEKINGALAITEHRVAAADVVIGITASGRTPFVLGALERAQEIGAKTVLLTCNPARASLKNVDIAIDLETGPELLTGSTRLKAGTATKVALNIMSTGAMVALGKARGNMMIDLRVTSEKLRDRAARLVADLTKSDYATAVSRLEQHQWNLRAAIDSVSPPG